MSLEARVADLRNQLSKRASFEKAVSDLTALFHEEYASASDLEQKLLYETACRVATLLQSRYTARGFWMAGLKLFKQAATVLTDSKEQHDMQKYVEQARGFIQEGEEEEPTRAGPSTSFLFEGQLTTDPEPPLPPWLAAHNEVALLAAQQNLHPLLQSIVSDLQSGIMPSLEEALQTATLRSTRGPPPASKDEVAKLPMLLVTDQVLKDIGEGTECAVCREVFVTGSEMQEMPCKHYFHPPCLKPWLDEHNSCPICRHELRTDDHEYESRKEREKEEEAARKGAANAVRDGELMYV